MPAISVRNFTRAIKNNNRGSLTVEACIAFPVFLCFFLLLIFFIKLACIEITLNHAANETAKQLATSCYPVSFLNEKEDEIIEEYGKYNITSFSDEAGKIKDYVLENGKGILSDLLSGNMDKNAVNEALKSLATGVGGELKNDFTGYLVNNFEDNYFEYKTKLKYQAAKALMDKFVEGSYIDRQKLEYVFVELPRGEKEFELRSKDESYTKACKEIGYENPDKDDVVVAVRYKADIPLPYFGAKEISLNGVAVERAWLYGSNGVYTGSSPGSFSLEKSKFVYVTTKAGQKYHKKDCRVIKNRNKKAITLKEAEKQYTPCKLCYSKQGG